MTHSIRGQNSGVRQAGFEFQLQYFLDNLVQVIFSMSLRLLTCKTGIVPVPTSYLHTGIVKREITWALRVLLLLQPHTQPDSLQFQPPRPLLEQAVFSAQSTSLKGWLGQHPTTIFPHGSLACSPGHSTQHSILKLPVSE